MPQYFQNGLGILLSCQWQNFAYRKLGKFIRPKRFCRQTIELTINVCRLGIIYSSSKMLFHRLPNIMKAKVVELFQMFRYNLRVNIAPCYLDSCNWFFVIGCCLLDYQLDLICNVFVIYSSRELLASALKLYPLY